jgi:mannose/cellobiose epimerase-like protein (N-acyl-D-glucosamine 2-epimerase family)
MSLPDLREDYRRRLFDRYLPFWDKGGVDSATGAVVCILNEDGTIAEDEVYNWFQGRALWVYSFLYNNFGRDTKYLDIARNVRDFMVKHMKADNGRWHEKVYRDGSIKVPVGPCIYGWMFPAEGLAEYYKAAGNAEDLDMALETMRASLAAYDSPSYAGSTNWGGYPKEMPWTGMRDQGHHMMFINFLNQLLKHHSDPELEKLAGQHVDFIMRRFFNPDYGIVNENLHHDYSRIEGFEDYMYIGHTLEIQWMVMFEALRTGNRALFDTCAANIRRNLELCWDYIFDGYAGDGHFYVFDGPNRSRDRMYNEKGMWGHTEVLIATLHILEYTGAAWAWDFYERCHSYSFKTFDAPIGVWSQGVDRFGKPMVRDANVKLGLPSKRKCNFHMPRAFMLNLLCLDRMIANGGKVSAFPG